MDYNIPPTTFLPIEQDDFSNYSSEPEEERSYTFLQQVKDILIVLSIIFVFIFTIFTLIDWTTGQRTLKETATSNFKWVMGAPSALTGTFKELYNRKSLEEIRAERIKGLSITETWGHNINALFPYTKPDSIYLEPSDLYTWLHPKIIATIFFSNNSGIQTTYNGSGTLPINAGSYTVENPIDSVYFNTSK